MKEPLTRIGAALAQGTARLLLFTLILNATAATEVGFGPLPGVDQDAKWILGNETLLVNHLKMRMKTTSRIPPPGRITVEVQFSLWKILEMNTKLQTLTVQGWWRHYWPDARMAWEPKQFGGISGLVMEPHDLWIPDVVIYNLVDSKSPGIESVSVSSDGSCRWLSQKVVTVGCAFDLAAFPFDTQHCNFTLGSNSFTGAILDVRPRKIDGASTLEAAPKETKTENTSLIADRAALDLANYRYNEEFALTKIRIIAHERLYSCCPESPYPEIIFDFYLQRQSLTYITGIIIPLLITTLVSFFTLLMPAPISGSRPALNVAIMFTTTAIYFVAGNKLPDIGSLTLISRLYMVSLIINLSLTLVSVFSTDRKSVV